MARPARAASTNAGHHAKEEIQARIEEEKKMRGNSDKLKPSSYLNAHQKKLFKAIVKELSNANILGNLDIYVLETTVIAIDRLQEIEKLVNEDIENLWDKTLMASKEKYTKDLWRGCSELSLSPSARAKIGNINVQAKGMKDDLLIKALRGEDI